VSGLQALQDIVRCLVDDTGCINEVLQGCNQLFEFRWNDLFGVFLIK
jgi:hypothetical protein